jgi:cytochrome c553
MRTSACLVVAGVFLFAAWAIAQENRTAPAELSATIASCESCHGPKGNSTSPAIPRLDGQRPDYIAARLKSFRDPTKEDPHAINAMWNRATHTGDEMVADLADYFGRQTPTEPQGGNDALAAKGSKLFAEGAPAQNIPACATCHGARGEGGRGVPRLAGQHAAYLKHAMEVLQMALRESDVMHPRLNNISDEQIKALAAWLAND